VSILGSGSNVSVRHIKTYEDLSGIIRACRMLGKKIILTSGTFDLLHIGHGRYFESARKSAGVDPDNIVLVVGVDSDAKVRSRKGPNRPIVPEDERVEMLCHIRHVDIVFIKGEKDLHWQLIKTVRPDVLIISERSKYNDDELEQLKEFCGSVVVLESQAVTSTSAKIRRLLVGVAEDVKKKIDVVERTMSEEFNRFRQIVDELLGGGEK